MEPAVGLGCILRSARREWEKEDKEKRKKKHNSTTSGASKYTYSMGCITAVQSATGKTEEEEEEEHSGHVSAFQNATVPHWIKWHLKKSIIGFNVTEAL